MKEEIFARGNMFELVHLPQPDGRVFEVARRAPGVRLIVADVKNKKVLLTKEFRRELNAWDFRLPGGKVFDSLEEYDQFRKGGQDIIHAARAKVKAEAAEEAGIKVTDVTFFKKSTLGATVEWDLYIFSATDWALHQDGQSLEAGEQVESADWYTYQDVQDMVVRGQMQEERIALALLQWIGQHGER